LDNPYSDIYGSYRPIDNFDRFNTQSAFDIPPSNVIGPEHPNYIPKLKVFSEPEGWLPKSERNPDPHQSNVNSFLKHYQPYNGMIPDEYHVENGIPLLSVKDKYGNSNSISLSQYQQLNPHIPLNAIQHMIGHGINAKKVKKGRGISSDYRDFGINKINHKKLNDGILTIRRKSNINIPDMPSKRISRKLQKIITHISGGGVPDFNDINNLDDSEKDYLHKLISKSNLNDRLSIPAPSKDQEEKDYHQFEVMKGEIMSGNDSKELVKKFKVLILKLSKQNVLPKNEVNELLQDLLSLGY